MVKIQKNKHPLSIIANKHKQINKTLFCFAYQDDLDNAYAFYCARYDNIKYDDFLKLGLFEFKKKLGSIPESEPLHTIIKSRVINIAKIKNKDEKKYWRDLKRSNKIPAIFLSNKELDEQLAEGMKNSGGLK